METKVQIPVQKKKRIDPTPLLLSKNMKVQAEMYLSKKVFFLLQLMKPT